MQQRVLTANWNAIVRSPSELLRCLNLWDNQGLPLATLPPSPCGAAGCLLLAVGGAVTWAPRSCHCSALMLLLLLCCCSCRLAFAHPKGYVSFAVFLVESDCHQHEWEFPSPFVSFCFPESHLNHWSLLHTISHRLCKDIFVYLSFLKPVPIFFKMYRISIFFHNP